MWRLQGRGQSFCRYKVQHDLAYVTIQLAKAKAVRMVRRRRVTYADLLGTLGKVRHYLLLLKCDTETPFRRYIWSLLGNEHHQLGRNCLLVY
jgi:hypothetical protein